MRVTIARVTACHAFFPHVGWRDSVERVGHVRKQGTTALVRAVMAVGMATSSCGAPPSGLPNGVTLRYGVSHMGGSIAFEVKDDGAAEYTATAGPTGNKHVRATATKEEIASLASVLRANRFCSLSSSRSKGVPDEARPSVRVRLQGLDCAVTLWDGEWHDDPAARACLSAVEDLGRALEQRGTP